MDAEFLNYAETQAAKNLDFQISCIDTITAQANKTLTVALLMISGCFAGFTQLYGNPNKVVFAWGFVGPCICLTVAAVLTVTRILSGREVKPPGHDPAILIDYFTDHTMTAVREAALGQTQEKIAANRDQTIKAGGHLKDVHHIMALSPLSYVVAAAVAAWVR